MTTVPPRFTYSRTAGNTAKQLDASLRKGGLGTGTNPAA